MSTPFVDSLLLIITIGFFLSLNDFFVAITMGISSSIKNKAQICFSITFFEFLMSFAGLSMGFFLAKRIGNFTSYISIIILLGLGIYIVWQGFITKNSPRKSFIITSGWGLILTSFGISLDNFTAGFSLGFSQYFPPILSTVIFSSLILIMVMLGLYLGKIINQHLIKLKNKEYYTSFITGLALVFLAFYMIGQKIF